MIDVIICFDHFEQNFNVAQNATLDSIFSLAKDKMGIEGNCQDFVFYNRDSIQIDSKPISSVLNNDTNSIRLFLISTNDYTNLNNYLNNICPSLVAQSAEFTQDAQKIIQYISSLHRFISNFSQEDVSLNIYSIIPIYQFDDLEGDKKVEEITRWFKEEFFTYVKELKCHNCGSDTQRLNKIGGVSKTEAKHLASHCELYECKSCGAITRFPRYNDVNKLLETKKGRCGEFSNMLGAILKALGYDIRLVTDMNDYLWVEFWSDEKGRYVHVDPCENIVDKPLTYEKGWGKKETWVIAIGENQCADVTPKYTQNITECIRRRSVRCPEEWYFKYIKFKNEEFMSSIEEEAERNEILEHQQKDSESMKNV